MASAAVRLPLLAARPPTYLLVEGVAGAPDISGDYVPDLLAGAPESGSVVFSGATGAVPRTLFR